MNGDRSVLARILVGECVVNLRQDLEDADKAVPELWSMPVPRTALSAWPEEGNKSSVFPTALVADLRELQGLERIAPTAKASGLVRQLLVYLSQ
jgi:hypothetical protein